MIKNLRKSLRKDLLLIIDAKNTSICCFVAAPCGFEGQKIPLNRVQAKDLISSYDLQRSCTVAKDQRSKLIHLLITGIQGLDKCR